MSLPSTHRFISPRAWNTVRVGFFIANRQIRANIGTTLLVSLVMMLTYLNLLVVSGLMVGIVQGLRVERALFQTGDITLSNFPRQDAIPNTPRVVWYLRSLPSVAGVSPRYTADGRLEGNYASAVRSDEHPDSIGARIIGIDPVAENMTTRLSRLVAEGEYLQPADYDQILVGTSLLARYKQLNALPGTTPLPDIGVGSKLRVMVGGVEREMTIKGVVASKLEEITLSAYVVDAVLRGMLGRDNYAANEIAVKLMPGADAAAVQQNILDAGFGSDAHVRLERESEPGFFKDFETTFNELGLFLGSIGLFVAFIVIFILVFINTVTHRRSIGILQAIGIQGSGIELSYVMQSVLYATIGAVIGYLIQFVVLIPYFSAHPIDFPFSNGILSVSIADVVLKALVLIFATILASYIPARMILRQEIVDAVLGR